MDSIQGSDRRSGGAVNYIQHINAWFAKVQADDRLNPSHICLYFALFQLWNANRFNNPISVARSEVMKLSKIGSTNTYTRCLKELDKWGYVEYTPSFNPLRGSTVNLFTFDNGSNTGTDKGAERVLRPYINSSKQTKRVKQDVNQIKKFDEPL
jgi:hypothetical protein